MTAALITNNQCLIHSPQSPNGTNQKMVKLTDMD